MKIIYLLAILPLIVTERSVSARGLAIIKEFEGFYSKAYRCPAGVWTIGYGTTDSDKSITGTSIYPGLTISEAKASEWLKKNLQNYIEDDWTSEKDFIEEFRKAMEE
jgi:GH24 family phage-related lysozyme (muramidase)